MTTSTLLLLATLCILLLVSLAAVLVLAFKRTGDRSQPEDSQALLQLQQQITDLARRLEETSKQIHQGTATQLQLGTKALTDLVQSTQSQVTGQVAGHTQTVGKAVSGLNEKLARFETEIKHLAEMGKDLRSLQDILQAPKVRGGFGEHLLENLLGNVLPMDGFELQYAFQGGERVDAVVKLPGGLVPIDAKFPLENFRRILEAESDEDLRRARKAFRDDVRKHGGDIASRYIRTGEGTLDLALIYVPAENVYYEAFVSSETGDGKTDLWEELLALRVFPVSPNTFALYLSTLALGLKGMRIEEGARRIVGALGALQKDFVAFQDSFELTAKHLNNAARNLEEARVKLQHLGWKLDQVEAEGPPSAIDSASTPEITQNETLL